MAQIGRLLVISGLILLFAGAILMLGEKVTWLRLGRLPGDLSWTSSSGTVRVYLPLMTMLLLSIFLSLVIWLLRK